MMERQAKPAKSPVTDTSHKQKVENLPLLCVETIFKFTQTSKLTRLYSNEVPLPGAFWQFGLEAALKRRLPLSLGDDPPHQHADDPAYDSEADASIRKANVPSAVFDASGALVASIKAPKAFADSPLCDLIINAALDFGVIGPQQSPAGGKIQAVKTEALLSSLVNVVELTLLDKHCCKSKTCLLTKLKHLLPRLQSFTIDASKFMDPFVNGGLIEFMRELPIHEMTSLQRLNIPEGAFKGVMQTANDNTVPVVRRGARRVLSGLRSLSIWQQGAVNINGENKHAMRREMLRSISVRCSHLTTLYLFVDNKFKPYLTAFRALTGLTTLGMYLFKLKGLAFINKNETINTVVDLRLDYVFPESRSTVFSVASFFPAAKVIAFRSYQNTLDALDLASEFCAKRVLPQLTRLNCFIKGELSTSSSVQWMRNASFELVTHVIANPYLPETVDLSEIIFESLVREPGLLTAIYKAMQANSTTSLIMRGPLHRDALTDLQRHIDSIRENAQVTAWKDRDLGEQPGVFNVEEISPQTNVTIVGHKSSGILVGQKFTIRIVHQLAKRRHIFD